MREDVPGLDNDDQSSRKRCPQTDEEQDPRDGANHCRRHRGELRCVGYDDSRAVKKKDSSRHPLNQETYARPTTGKCPKQALQKTLPIKA